ncbi:MAG TPA: urea carboxylase-associated family protein [Chloroflexota bacterium]|nr:urea carboxylase-associated family protein [Chloroflexota bacterium]
MAETIHIPAREGRGARISVGTRFRVVDPQGGQVGDLFAFNARDIREYASAEHTRVFNNRLFPRLGEHFVTNKRRPILLFEEDNSPGVHDMLCAACDPARFELLGVEGWHASCQENLRTVMAGFGHEYVEVPQPINLFMNIPVTMGTPNQEDGEIGWEPALTKAGDAVTMRAEMDCYIVVSACPQDIIVINENKPSPLEIQIL